ncbi:MAG: lipopolysaccharide biosynthesis protein, partial [Segetibacter sp.]
MGEIRRQSILSSIVIYIGFAIGFINTYLYVKNGTFTTVEYGLTRLFNDIGITFFSFASLGVTSYIYKFQPFYKQNLSRKENDQAALCVIIVSLG